MEGLQSKLAKTAMEGPAAGPSSKALLDTWYESASHTGYFEKQEHIFNNTGSSINMCNCEQLHSQKRNILHITPFRGLYELMSEWTVIYKCEIILFKLLFVILHLLSYLTNP